MVTSSKSFACWVTVGPSSRVWGLCGVCATVRLVSSRVGRVGGVVPLDGEHQGECHEEVQEGPFAPSWGILLPGHRQGLRPALVRTVYLRVRMYLQVRL